jgi:hypothetical protein
MAPCIPTHRPVLTATRVAIVVAAAAVASSVFLVLGALPAIAAPSCVLVQAQPEQPQPELQLPRAL